MRQKILDFLYSYGLMGMGLLLLFIASVSLKTGSYPLLRFPEVDPLASSPGLARAEIGAPVAVARQGGGDALIKMLPPSKPTIPLAKNRSEFDGELSAASALLVDDKTDTVLFAKDSGRARPLASITKLMTMLVLLDLPMSWSSTTVITEADCDASSHHINAGEKYTLDDLWHVALVGSSNSAIAALVRESGITPENFALLMNKKAKALGLNSAVFSEPTGLDAANQASAEDAARLLKEALKSEKIVQTMRIGEYYAQPLNKEKKRRVWSTNWLLTNWIPNKFAKDCIAGKTGYIADAGYNFAVRLEDERGRAVRAVVLGAVSNEARFTEARDLAEWAFGHYLWPEDKGYEELVE